MREKRSGYTVPTCALALALLALALWPEARPALAAERVGGVFTIERADLRFVGGEKMKVLTAGQEARAEVEVTFAGTGQLNGAWEIAEPTTTAGSPRFRTLELVSRTLGMGHREVLASPPLPTGATGAYLLRLRITTPEAAGPPLVVKYFVGQPGAAAAAPPPAAIVASGPAAGSPADRLAFSWQPVPGSIAYQLEIYESDQSTATGPAGSEESQAACLISLPSSLGRPPVTGIMIPGDQTQVALNPVAAGRLAAGRTYLWRVVALDRDGKVLCESPLQELAR
jgi:hypothetical protein